MDYSIGESSSRVPEDRDVLANSSLTGREGGRRASWLAPVIRLGLAASASTLTVGIAHAQVAGSSPPPSVTASPSTDAPSDAMSTSAAPAPTSSQIQDIVVTAQRRGQNLQDVPLSVTAFNNTALVRSGVTTVRDVDRIDPSISIGLGSGVVIPFLRGVGNPSATEIGNEASVPVYIDDVYYTRLSSVDLELANVERVEVLKGPQGTLFGRNASGGAIQVFTRDPGSAPELEMHAGYGNYDTFSGRLYASAPLTNTIGASISVSGLNQGHGWGENLFNGQSTYKNKFINVRGKIVAELTPTTKVTLSGFYNHQLTGQGVDNTIYRGTVSGTPAFYGPPTAVFPPPFYDSINSYNSFVRHTGYGAAAKIVQSLDFADIVSISAYRRARELYETDGDSVSQNFLLYNLHGHDRQISEELQLKSKTASKFDWIIGGFYLNSKEGYQPGQITGDAISAQGLQALDIESLQKVSSLSAYGQATFHVIPENTNITLGLRYTSDQVRGIGGENAVISPSFSVPAIMPYDKQFTFKKLTYKVAIDHKFADHVLGYASISRGYKSGTFNTLPLTGDPSRPETVEAYELGVKSELFDRRLRLNVAIFQNDIRNPQVETVITTGDVNSVGLTNGKKARSRGVEINSDLVVAEGFNLHLGGTYLDAKYLDFQDAPFYFPLSTSPYGNTAAIPGDASGKRLAQVPKWRVTAGADYNLKTSVGDFAANVNAAYTSRIFWDADNILQQKSVTLLNASLTYHLNDNDRWSVMLWGKNLANRHYYSSDLTEAGSNGSIAAVAAPRTFGVEVGFKL